MCSARQAWGKVLWEHIKDKRVSKEAASDLMPQEEDGGLIFIAWSNTAKVLIGLTPSLPGGIGGSSSTDTRHSSVICQAFQ
jgi:predicted GNAT superfamily acetyltransferase